MLNSEIQLKCCKSWDVVSKYIWNHDGFDYFSIKKLNLNLVNGMTGQDMHYNIEIRGYSAGIWYMWNHVDFCKYQE